jgi:hypothetical protein
VSLFNLDAELEGTTHVPVEIMPGVLQVFA